jgi:hypothetical protein
VHVVGEPYTFAKVVRRADVNGIDAARVAPAVARQIALITNDRRSRRMT